MTRTHRSQTRSAPSFLLALLTVLSLGTAAAAPASPADPAAPPSAGPTPVAPPSAGSTPVAPPPAAPPPTRAQPEPQGESVINVTVNHNPTSKSDIPTLRWGDTLTIELSAGGVKRLRALSESKHQELGLYLDGFFLKKTTPYPDPSHPDRLNFVPVYEDDDKLSWNKIILSHGGAEGLAVTVGFPDKELVRSEHRVRLALLPHRLAASLALALLLLAGLFYAGANTSMLRDGAGITDPESDPLERTFSLGRSQMAWWTVLVIWAFAFLSLITGSAQLTPSMLTLLGLGASTALGSLLIDRSKHARAVQARRGAASAAGGPGPGDGASSGPALASLERDALPMFTSEGWLTDVLSDDYGISLPRVQNLLWTLVLSAVFVRSVLTRLAMPEFDDTLLALMGISSGAYLGFKLPEKTAVAPAAPRGAGPVAAGAEPRDAVQ